MTDLNLTVARIVGEEWCWNYSCGGDCPQPLSTPCCVCPNNNKIPIDFSTPYGFGILSEWLARKGYDDISFIREQNKWSANLRRRVDKHYIHGRFANDLYTALAEAVAKMEGK